MTKRLEILAPENFSLVEPGDNLPALILNSLKQEGMHSNPVTCWSWRRKSYPNPLAQHCLRFAAILGGFN